MDRLGNHPTPHAATNDDRATIEDRSGNVMEFMYQKESQVKAKNKEIAELKEQLDKKFNEYVGGKLNEQFMKGLFWAKWIVLLSSGFWLVVGIWLGAYYVK
jgi:hypothetical protein